MKYEWTMKEFEEENQRALEEHKKICKEIERLISKNWIMREGGVDVSAPISLEKFLYNLTYNKNTNIMYTNI